MTDDVVLLVTASYDLAADHVSDALSRLGVPTFRLDTDRFPMEVKATFDPASGLVLRQGDECVQSRHIRSVWYRRNVDAGLPKYLDQYNLEFCRRESRAFLEGALLSIPTTRWISYPAAIWLAERKVYQLSVALELGFNLPSTMITNDDVAARGFTESLETIAKAVSSGYVDSPDGYRAMFTTSLARSDLDDLDTLRLAPVTFQEKVRKASDIRVTVVGDDIFAAEIMSQSHQSSETDWRATENPDIEHRLHELPDRVKTQCLMLVDRLGLEFGAIDLALTAPGEYTFFEINPNGEWLWLEYQLGFPIADRIAKWLVS